MNEHSDDAIIYFKHLSFGLSLADLWRTWTAVLNGKGVIFRKFSERAARWWLVLILVIGILLRAGALIFIGKAHVAWQLEFEEIATNLVDYGKYFFSFYGYTVSRPTSFIPPVYPLFLASARLLWPVNGYWLVKVTQIFASELTILGIYALTRELGGSTRQGMLTALIWALYPPAIAYASDLSTVTLETFFIIPGIWLLLRAGKRRLPILVIPAGILLSLATLTRSTWLVVSPLAVIWLVVFIKGRWRVWGKYVLFFVLAVGVMLAPWVIYNSKVQDRWLLSSTNGGLNFWIGNNPHATGEYIWPLDLDRNLILEVTNLSETARDQFFYTQGFKFIRNSPGEFLSLLGRKLLYFIFFRPNIGSNYESAHILMLNLAVMSFMAAWLALIPFALFGLFHLNAHWREHSLLILIFFANLATTVLYFTGTRFRTPVDGFVVIWAAIGLTKLIGNRRQQIIDRTLAPDPGK
jgi:hypothetical protein